MVGRKEGKKMFLGNVKMFSVPLKKRLYWHATKLVY